MVNGWNWGRCLAVVAIVFLAVLGLVPSAPAAVIEPGVRYQGRVDLEAPGLGVGFTLPQGWIGVLPVGGQLFIMTPDDRSYVFASADQTTVEAMKADLSRPLPLTDSIVLQPKGSVTVDGQTITAAFDVTGAPEPHVAAGRARIGAHGVGIGFIAIGPASAQQTLNQVLDQLLASVAFVPPQAPPQAVGGAQSNGGSGDNWASYMRGRYIVRFFTRTGYTEKEQFWLCSDGRFRHLNHASGDSGVIYHQESFGRWQATGIGNFGTLVLNFKDGTTANRPLEYRDDKLYLDGTQYLRDRNDYCP